MSFAGGDISPLSQPQAGAGHLMGSSHSSKDISRGSGSTLHPAIKSPPKGNFQSFVRIKPFEADQREIKGREGNRPGCLPRVPAFVVDEGAIRLTEGGDKRSGWESFTSILGPDQGNHDVFATIVPLLTMLSRPSHQETHALSQRAVLFCVGGSGSGKTHTLEGSTSIKDGIVPQIIKWLSSETSEDFTYQMTITEYPMAGVRKPSKVHLHSQFNRPQLESALKSFSTAAQARCVGHTSQNASSSRSILEIEFHVADPASTLHIFDLPGREYADGSVDRKTAASGRVINSCLDEFSQWLKSKGPNESKRLKMLSQKIRWFSGHNTGMAQCASTLDNQDISQVVCLACISLHPVNRQRTIGTLELAELLTTVEIPAANTMTSSQTTSSMTDKDRRIEELLAEIAELHAAAAAAAATRTIGGSAQGILADDNQVQFITPEQARTHLVIDGQMDLEFPEYDSALAYNQHQESPMMSPCPVQISDMGVKPLFDESAPFSLNSILPNTVLTPNPDLTGEISGRDDQLRPDIPSSQYEEFIRQVMGMYHDSDTSRWSTMDFANTLARMQAAKEELEEWRKVSTTWTAVYTEDLEGETT